MLAVRGLCKAFRVHRGSRIVLRDVSFTLARSETLAIVGRSGAGKTTLARCVAGFETPDAGEILLNGRPIGRAERPRVQLIFQQPAASLNPRFTAQQILEEPLVIQRRDRRGAAARAMELVGLPPGALGRRAHQFSGGERQRLAIARALVLDPAVLILDESFAGLDWRLRDQAAALLGELRERLGIACLLIAHDFELAARMAQSLAVMEEGAIVEQGPTAEIMAAPRHPLTRELIAAARALSLEDA
ncbi:MAG: ATP-binding cassette domain-containing protein [Acidobacteriota bacterium]|nr:ATP-binding cassette domain-containing protein [Acidobacteriota bacterium]